MKDLLTSAAPWPRTPRTCSSVKYARSSLSSRLAGGARARPGVDAGIRSRAPVPLQRVSSLGRAVATVLAAAMVAGLLGVAPAAAGGSDPPSILYAQAGALWHAAPKAAARNLGAIPVDAGAVVALSVDPASTAVLLGTERGWYWAPLLGRATLDAIDADVVEAPALGGWKKLPCASATAALAPDGTAVLCGTMAGTTMLVNLTTGARLTRNVPVEHAALAGRGGELRLIWTDKEGIWAAPLAPAEKNAAVAYRLGEPKRVAAEAPQRGFAASPSGLRGVGIYPATAHRGKKLETRELLSTFALDGRAARRKLMAEARVIAWSADSAWALVQSAERACVIAAAGGQYKCWKGFRAEAISPDGRFALLAGDRSEEQDAAGKKATGKGARGKAASKEAAKPPAPAKPAPTRPPAPTLAAPAGVTLPDDASDAPSDDGSDGGSDDDEQAEGAESQPGAEEGGEATEPAPDGLGAARHLYRATLDGAFTAPPVRVLAEHPGPAAFVRGR